MQKRSFNDSQCRNDGILLNENVLTGALTQWRNQRFDPRGQSLAEGAHWSPQGGPLATTQKKVKK